MRSASVVALLLFWLGGSILVAGADATHPLKPADRSSPRAALQTFLETSDTFGAYLGDEYLKEPTRAKFRHLLGLAEEITRSLDLSEVPPAARLKTGRAAAMALYGTLNRLELPPFETIPAGNDSDATNRVRWVLPNTRIALVRQNEGPQTGEFLFSTDTIAHADEYFAKVRALPYARRVPLERIREITFEAGGWMIPYPWIQALPAPLKSPVAGQPVWKWLALGLLAALTLGAMVPAYRLSLLADPDRPLLRAISGAALPAFILLAAPVFAYLTLVQVNVIGSAGSGVQLAVTAVMYLAGGWICWRVAPVVAEAIIASPRIAPESIDAHLIRIATRLLGIVGATVLLVLGADRLGLPLYGLLAGLGVGGLAIALAAQPAIENLLGGLSLYADKPARIGDLCKYGSDVGTVESIGLRSTRMRGSDRTLTSIPNAVLAKLPIVNLSRRDKTQIQSVLNLRYDTSPDQLRRLLARLREMLLSHPRVERSSADVHFTGFGTDALRIEVSAYVLTADSTEFLAIQEELFLRMLDQVEASGTGLSIPAPKPGSGAGDGPSPFSSRNSSSTP